MNPKRLISGAVYPRWRGEHIGGDEIRELASGLSPLARGTLGNSWVANEWNRFIPAGAGNT